MFSPSTLTMITSKGHERLVSHLEMLDYWEFHRTWFGEERQSPVCGLTPTSHPTRPKGLQTP